MLNKKNIQMRFFSIRPRSFSFVDLLCYWIKIEDERVHKRKELKYYQPFASFDAITKQLRRAMHAQAEKIHRRRRNRILTDSNPAFF